MKPIQEAVISEASLLLSLLTYVEDTWAYPHTLEVTGNIVFLFPPVALGVVQCLGSLGIMGLCVKPHSLEPSVFCYPVNFLWCPFLHAIFRLPHLQCPR